MVVEVDPHIRSGDIEIPLDDLAVSRAATPTSPIDQVALDALLAQMGGKR